MRTTVVVLLCALAACAAASSAHASNRIQYGIQDDAWLQYGPGTLEQRVATFDRLGVPLVRVALHWNQIAATSAPCAAASPRGRAYDWRRPHRVSRAPPRHGLTPLLP